MVKISRAAEEAIQQLVDAIVRADFEALESDGSIGRLTVEEIKRAIDDYGRTLISLPENAFDEADVFPIDKTLGVVAVDVPLWTAEEGRSDLTLSVSVEDCANGPTVLIDDLHVL